jgi:hypothetical protein
MTTLIHHLAARLRGWANNRRRADRYETELEAQINVRLLLSVSLSEAQAKPTDATRPSRLIGSTRNVSETGLAIVVPSLRVGPNLITEENCSLRIVLDIYPSGLVEMEAVAVHSRQFDEKEKEAGYLVGVRITEMSEDDRSRYLEYLGTLDRRDLLQGEGRVNSTRPV